MLPHAVDLLALDLPEALALRAVLELYQVRVNLFTVERDTDVLSALNGDAPHLVISAHGDGQGFILPELDREVVPDDPFWGHLTPARVRTHAQLRGRFVIATACDSGSPAFAKAFRCRRRRLRGTRWRPHRCHLLPRPPLLRLGLGPNAARGSRVGERSRHRRLAAVPSL